jgi:hypothetical protein
MAAWADWSSDDVGSSATSTCGLGATPLKAPPPDEKTEPGELASAESVCV